jgi:hypothetical protein
MEHLSEAQIENLHFLYAGGMLKPAIVPVARARAVTAVYHPMEDADDGSVEPEADTGAMETSFGSDERRSGVTVSEVSKTYHFDLYRADVPFLPPQGLWLLRGPRTRRSLCGPRL